VQDNLVTEEWMPTNGAPRDVLGSSHFELRNGKIIRQWRIFDEIAVIPRSCGRTRSPRPCGLTPSA
jgi:hypothetical protein